MNQQSSGQVSQCEGEWAGPHEVDGISDGKLLGRFVLDREQAVFEALVRRHGPMVRRVCRRFLDNGAAAEDACQETFIILLRKAHLLGQPERLAGWLYGVAARIALRARCQAVRREVYEKRAAVVNRADPSDEILRRDLAAVVKTEVEQLPRPFREALILRFFEGKTDADAAAQMGCPRGSMSWRLRRGCELLRQRLSGRGENDRTVSRQNRRCVLSY
jgi:RNA polymerase sigma factor (sigma-70 family)